MRYDNQRTDKPICNHPRRESVDGCKRTGGSINGVCGGVDEGCDRNNH